MNAQTQPLDSQTTVSVSQGRLIGSPIVWTVLMLWGASATFLASKGVFNAPPDEPPLAILIAALGPAVIFLVVYAVFRPLREWTDALDISEVIGVQSWRVIGFAFLAVWALGDLPAVFALPAGIGDVAVGVAAPAAAIAAARKAEHWRAGAYGVTVAGLADFIIAFATGILSREGQILHFDGAPASSLLGVLPLTLFPTFIVPAFLILHVIALLKLRD